MLGSLPLRRRGDQPRRFRRGVYLLPSLFTVANLFCGYACVVHATRADFDTAALFIGIAMVLDTMDGLIARLTNTSSAFGVQLDSLADVVSFGLAPAILAFTWGLWPLERLGWAAGGEGPCPPGSGHGRAEALHGTGPERDRVGRVRGQGPIRLEQQDVRPCGTSGGRRGRGGRGRGARLGAATRRG
jgi:hypothetical protein